MAPTMSDTHAQYLSAKKLDDMFVHPLPPLMLQENTTTHSSSQFEFIDMLYFGQLSALGLLILFALLRKT